MFNMFILNMRQIFFLPDVLFILKIPWKYFQKIQKKIIFQVFFSKNFIKSRNHSQNSQKNGKIILTKNA